MYTVMGYAFVPCLVYFKPKVLKMLCCMYNTFSKAEHSSPKLPLPEKPDNTFKGGYLPESVALYTYDLTNLQKVYTV